MVTPVINNIVPFDVGVGTVFTFQYTGGITDSYFEIFDVNNTIIYDSRNDDRVGTSQLKQRIIPSATNEYFSNGNFTTNPLSKMVNNAMYYIQLTVVNGDKTSTSQKRLFHCITTPLLSVYSNDGTNKPLENSYTLETATFELYAEYSQAIVDGKIYEDLNSYQIVLYDNNYQVVYTSDVYYNLLDNNNEHVYIRINGLEQKRYFLKVIGKTINGYLIDNDLITIDVEYKSNTQKTTLYVENCHEDGFIKIGTNIHALLYRLKYSPAKFVDDVIQLKDNWLEYYDGLTIDGDYVAYVRFKNPNYNTNLVRISGEGHNVYMNCYKHDTYMSMVEIEETYGDILLDEDVVKDSYLYFDLRIYTENKVEMLVSDKFSVQKMEDAWFNAFIVRKGSTYSFLVIPDKYKMIYMLYDGLNDSRNPLNYEEGETLYLYDATKRGNSFGGWYSNDSFASDTKITSPFIAPNNAMTVYAKWIPNIYNISYNVLDEATNTNPNTYTYGTTTVLSDAEKTGYEFLGWYTDDVYSNQITEIGSDEIDDKVLFGKFEPKVYSMIYNLNGGVNNDRNPSTYTTDAEVRLYNPTRDGYDFGGWYYDSSFNNSVSSPFIAPPENTTVYARWTVKTYSITYVDGGDTNENPATYAYGTTTTLLTPSKDGYNFIGWYTDDTFSEKITYISSTTTGDITLYAKWEAIQYTISYKTSYYNSIDGTLTGSADNPTTYYPSDTFELSDAIPDDSVNYKFDGWYKDSSCSDEYRITSVENQVGNLNLYAKFTPKYDFKYVWRDGDSISGDTSGWLITFTSLAQTKDEIYIPSSFDDNEIIGFVANQTSGVFMYNNTSANNRIVKSTVRFSVDKNSKLFEADEYGNLFLKEYTYTQYNIYNPNGTNTQNKVLLSYNDSNIFSTTMINDASIKAIGRNAFVGCVNLNTIVLPENITLIYDHAFANCSNLSTIYLCTTSGNSYYFRRACSGYSSTSWSPTDANSFVSCTIYVKTDTIRTLSTTTDSSFITVYKYKCIDSKQTISTDYDWEVPEL